MGLVNMKVLFLCFIARCFVFTSSLQSNLDVPGALIQKLSERIKSEMITEDVPYILGKQWAQRQWMYANGIHLNTHGGPLARQIRGLEIPDTNVYFTVWTTIMLLQSYLYGKAPKPFEEHLQMAVEILDEAQDKNAPFENSIVGTWPQIFDDEISMWNFDVANIKEFTKFLSELQGHKMFQQLQLLGLDLEKIVPLSASSAALQTFQILSAGTPVVPDDFDNTAGNTIIGSLLYRLKGTFSMPWDTWNSQNSNLTSVLDALKYYAYRPFSDDPTLNSINPKSYYAAKHFLDQAAENGQDVALIPTYTKRKEILCQEGRTNFVSDLDAVVQIDQIYSIVSSVLSGILSPDVLDDQDLAMILLNTSSYIAHIIDNNFWERPELVLTYYPSEAMFYSFVSNVIFALEEIRSPESSPHPILESVHQILKSSAEVVMTKMIMESSNNLHDDGSVYVDHFLGNADVSEDGTPLNLAEDRIFSTAMSANALMSTWLVFDGESDKLLWKQNTPQKVKQQVSGMIKWLASHTLDENFKPWNCFFTAFYKDVDTMDIWYPATHLEDTSCNPIQDSSRDPRGPIVASVRGYVPKEKYEDMLLDEHFGRLTPREFKGYNTEQAVFQFWSGDSVTYASSLLALSRFVNIDE